MMAIWMFNSTTINSIDQYETCVTKRPKTNVFTWKSEKHLPTNSYKSKTNRQVLKNDMKRQILLLIFDSWVLTDYKNKSGLSTPGAGIGRFEPTC